MSDEWWDGGTWCYFATRTNDASNAGVHTWEIQPGAGNEMELLGGHFFHDSADALALAVRVTDDEDNNLYLLLPWNVTASQSQYQPFPATDEMGGNGAALVQRLIISGTMKIRITHTTNIGTSKKTQIGLACRIRGTLPTVTSTGPTGSTESVSKNQVF